MAKASSKIQKPLSEAEAQAIIKKINDIYHNFELEIERLRKKRDRLIDEASNKASQEKIKKIRQQLK